VTNEKAARAIAILERTLERLRAFKEPDMTGRGFDAILHTNLESALDVKIIDRDRWRQLCEELDRR
jgi:hypothetical protein